jgi:hypothetical protein
MGKFAKFAIVFIVAVIVIATGFLYETGRLSLPSTGKISTQYPTTSPQYNSPNVVSSNQVNKSVGGSWTQTTGTTGTSSNASAGIGILEGDGGSYFSSYSSTPLTTYVLPGYSQLVNRMPFLSFSGSSHSSGKATSYVSAPTSTSPSVSGITSLELAVFQPVSGTGIVTVGYISERNQSEVSHIWAVINDSAQNSTTSNVTLGFTSSGTPYVYAFVKSNEFIGLFSGLNTTSDFVNVMISVYSHDLILVLHLSTVNVSKSSILSLMNSEVTILKNPAPSPSHSIFLNSSQIEGQTGLLETNFLQVDVNIQNASSLFREFVNTSNTATTQSESAYLNDALSNLSAIAFSAYGNGSGNSTLIGLAKFNNYYNATLFNALFAIFPNTQQFVNLTYNGSRYIFLSANTTEGTMNDQSYVNVSLMFFDYKSYIGVIEIEDVNGKLVSQSGMKVLLGDEISLL